MVTKKSVDGYKEISLVTVFKGQSRSTVLTAIQLTLPFAFVENCLTIKVSLVQKGGLVGNKQALRVDGERMIVYEKLCD